MTDVEIVNKRKEIIDLFEEGLHSVLPENLFKKYIALHGNLLIINSINQPSQIYDLGDYKNIYITGAGKASSSMAQAAENLLGDRIHAGISVTKYGFSKKLDKIELLEAGHPIPDENSINAAKKILNLFNEADIDDLIINLISGGTSSLLSLPVDGISLENKTEVTKLLLSKEVSIQEINTVRNCISKVKGGGLVSNCNATIITLIISDVIGDELKYIGSGPTVYTREDYKSAINILNEYGLLEKIPDNVRIYLEEGASKQKETADVNESRRQNYLIGNNDILLNKIADLAKGKGFNTFIIDKKIEGEVGNAADNYFSLIEDLNIDKPACIVSGGETTVNIKGNGKGGRNQEFCLFLAGKIRSNENIIVLSGGSDGNDGPTDAAGAVIDNNIILDSEVKKLNYKDYLSNNDSYNFFNQTNGLIKTGPTLTNVGDVQITIIN